MEIVDNIEKSRLQRFIDSPWAIALAGAGAIGAITLMTMLLLRKRKRSRDESRQIKEIAGIFSEIGDQTSALIQAGQEIAAIVDPGEVAEIAQAYQELVPNDDGSNKTSDALTAIAAVAGQQG